MTWPGADLFPSDTTYPSTGAAVLDAWESKAEVTIGSLTVSSIDGNGVDWICSAVDGWDGSPGSSIQLTQRTRAAGSWASPRNLQSRVLTITGATVAPSSAALIAALDQLKSAASLNDTTITVTLGGVTRSINAARQGEVLVTPITDSDTFAWAQWSVQMIASDPRKFTAAVSDATGLPSTSGGLVVPLVVPAVMSSTVVSGVVGLTNPGNATGPVKLRIDGPCNGPVVTHVGSGLQLQFAASLLLAAGEWIDVDMEAQTVLANGQSSRNSFIVNRGWFGLEPGDNIFRFNATTYDPAAQLTVVGTPAWL